MIPDSLSLLAAKACKDVYQKNIDLGTTEYSDVVSTWKGQPIQILSIAGTNEFLDWRENLNIWSKKGIKKSAYDAAKEIKSRFCKITDIPLLVTGHSKAGATAIAWKKLYGADYCIAFCSARSLRYWTERQLENTKLFIDKNDLVPKLGFVSFGHPICDIEYLPDDHFGLSIRDHFMDHIIKYLEEKK